MLGKFFRVRGTDFGLPASEGFYSSQIYLIAITAQATTYAFLNTDIFGMKATPYMFMVGLITTVSLFSINVCRNNTKRQSLYSYGRAFATIVADVLSSVVKLVWVPIISDFATNVSVSNSGTSGNIVFEFEVGILERYGLVFVLYAAIFVVSMFLYFHASTAEKEHFRRQGKG